MTFMEEMQEYPTVVAARAKIKDLPENFYFYLFEWLGDIESDNCVMKLEGCVMRPAKSGPRKGQMVMQVPGTMREAFLTAEEVRNLKD